MSDGAAVWVVPGCDYPTLHLHDDMLKVKAGSHSLLRQAYKQEAAVFS